MINVLLPGSEGFLKREIETKRGAKERPAPLYFAVVFHKSDHNPGPLEGE